MIKLGTDHQKMSRQITMLDDQSTMSVVVLEFLADYLTMLVAAPHF
jgi:hypothetical protein